MHLDPDLIRPVLCQARCSETIASALSPIGDKNAIVFIVRKVSNWTQNVRHGGQIGSGKTKPIGLDSAIKVQPSRAGMNHIRLISDECLYGAALARGEEPYFQIGK